MGAKENFSPSLQLETSESIRGDLSEAKNPVLLYKKAVEVLGKMERNFDNALGNNAYDYFDGNVDTDLDKTEFEKKAQELSSKAKELCEQMSIGSALYVLAQSKLGISSVEQQELDSLVQELLQTQERAKQQIESDLEDGRLDEDSHIAPDFVDFNESENKGEPIIEIQTQGGHQFIFSRLEDYNPPTSPQKIEIEDPKVRAVVEGLNVSEGGADNIDETDPEKFKKWLVEYLNKTPDILEKYAIIDHKQLTPKQAIQLASEITTRHLDYDYEQITFFGRFTKGIFDNDNDSVDELLEEGEGVCRNYKAAVKVIFDALRLLQTPETTSLANTYATLDGTSDFKSLFTEKSSKERNIVDEHGWNSFYTVSPSGEVQGLVVDATWADEKGKDMENPDYTDSRFLFNLERMVIEGLLTQEQKITQLEKWCQNPENSTSPSYKVCTQEIGDYYLRNGDNEKGLDWYFKVPSVKDLARIQDKYNISEKSISLRIQDNAENVQFASFFAKYFYKKGDYKKAIEFGLRSMKHEYSFDALIVLVASCIRNGTEEWKENDYSVDTFLDKPNWFEEDYPEELKLIAMKYGNKDK